MNYFPFHLGDYAAHTAHLEPMEDLAYRRMLDLYYLREDGLPGNAEEVARLIRMRSNVGEVAAVLKEFFRLDGDSYRHDRCDEEIAKMKDKQAKARASAQASVNARSANAQRPLNEGSATNTNTNTNTKEEKGAKAPSSAKPTIPCPYQSIVDLYHRHLPSLPRVKLMPAQRQRALRKVWGWVLSSLRSDGSRRAENADEALAWFGDYFARAAHNDFLTGKAPRGAGHENWQCDLDFLLTDKGMKQVIEKTQEAA